MRKRAGILLMSGLFIALVSGTALATPSTQIWIPSTDIQAYNTAAHGHRRLRQGCQEPGRHVRADSIHDAGLTVGRPAVRQAPGGGRRRLHPLRRRRAY